MESNDENKQETMKKENAGSTTSADGVGGTEKNEKAEQVDNGEKSNQSGKKKDQKKKKKKKKELTLEEKYKQCQQEINKWKEKYIYLQAEMENSQKIGLKRIDAARYHSKVNTIKMFLPLVESFEGAILRLEKDPKLSENNNQDKYLKGFYQVYNQYKQILKSAGVRPIDKTDVPLDYNEHEVMMKTNDEDKPEDTVVQIIQKGWYLGKNVLRPAKVIVSKKPPTPEPEVEKDSGDKVAAEDKNLKSNAQSATKNSAADES